MARNSLLDPQHGFVDWWKVYPRHDRKVGKPEALRIWIKQGCANDATLIKEYTQFMPTTDGWLRGYMPGPVPFLRLQGWVDWQPVALKAETVWIGGRREIDLDLTIAAKPSADILAKLKQIRNGVTT